MNKSIQIQKIVFLALALFTASTMMAGAQDRAPRKASEVRFNLPSPRKFFNVELPTPEKIIQIIEQVKEIIVPPICPLPPEEPSFCSFSLNDVAGISGNFDIDWHCTGNFKPCSIYADDILVGQVNDSGSAKFNIGAKRSIAYQLKDKNDRSCGTGVAHLFQTGSRPPQPTFSRTFIQSGYRWHSSADSITPGGALAALNTAYTFDSATNIRLRMLVRVGNLDLDGGTQTFKLQYATKITTCAAATYADVGTVLGDQVQLYNNTTPTDDTAISAIATDPTDGSNTVIPQTYEEQNNISIPTAIAAGQNGVWDFSLRIGPPVGTTSCIRLVKSDGTAFDDYSFYPEITTNAGYGFGGSSRIFALFSAPR